MYIQRIVKTALPFIAGIFLFGAQAYSDMPPEPGYEKISVTEILTNIDEFRGFSFIAYAGEGGFIGPNAKFYLIKGDHPINRFHDLFALGKGYTIYAVKTNYLEGKELNTIDFSHDPNLIPMSGDLERVRSSSYYTNEVKKHIVEYTILGFRDGQLVIYKSKEILKYGLFKRNKTVTFKKPDMTGIVRSF